MQLAADKGSSFSFVLPEFQYLKAPVDRGPNDPFDAADHALVTDLETDVFNFLKALFVDKSFKVKDEEGNEVSVDIPADFILELGNEDFFGWNGNLATPDSAKDLDSYSAYVYGCLSAIDAFRAENPAYADAFKVSMQAHGANYVAEIAANFSDMDALDLFAHIDVIDTKHIGLDATLDKIVGFEDNWTLTTGIDALNALISVIPTIPPMPRSWA